MSVSCNEIKGHKSCFQSESTKDYFVKVKIKLMLKSICKRRGKCVSSMSRHTNSFLHTRSCVVVHNFLYHCNNMMHRETCRLKLLDGQNTNKMPIHIPTVKFVLVHPFHNPHCIPVTKRKFMINL